MPCLLNYNSIIASTYGGDIKDFEAKAKKIEKSKTLPKEKFECLREYTSKSREEQEQIRQKSRTLRCPESLLHNY